jgi:hypothetical protein
MSLAVFVNTSDGYKDCWPPFFQLFERYGGWIRGLPIYLNTERESYAWPGLDLRSTAVWPTECPQRPSWGERAARGLEAVTEAYVLYLQEDFFLTCPVRDEVIERALDHIRKNDDVGVVYLNEKGPRYRTSQACGPGVVEIIPPAAYLVTTSAAIWRKGFLLSLLKPWENVWMFEKFASVRGRRAKSRYLSVAPEVLAESPVIDYGNTGIFRGRWQAECVPLFEREGLSIDYSRRGFYRRGGRLKTRLEVLKRILENPGNAFRSLMSLV